MASVAVRERSPSDGSVIDSQWYVDPGDVDDEVVFTPSKPGHQSHAVDDNLVEKTEIALNMSTATMHGIC